MASPAPRRRWRRLGPHEYMLRMGPVTVEVFRAATARMGSDDRWWWRADAVTVGRRPLPIAGRSYTDGAPLAQCQADAIAAVERWRDSIR